MSHDISSFLEETTALLGPDHVLRGGPTFEERCHDPVFTTKPPEAFIYPDSTEHVSAIVKLANTYNVPLWPYSTAKNWGYCNTTGERGAVVIVLERMNRILHVDTELAYAEIEPGVSYEQLSRHMQDNNTPLWIDPASGPPSASVIGNALDRGVGVTPYGDHFANLCGLEAVLPDGTVIRTGGFGTQERSAWHTYKWGIGPSMDGFFTQSNFGIVTRAGIWLMRAPEDFVVGSLRLSEKDPLGPALDGVRELMLAGIIPERGRFSNDVAMLTLLTQARDERTQGGKALSEEDIAALRKKYSVGVWTGSFGIFGIRSHVRLMRRQAKKRLAGLGYRLFLTEKKARRLQRLINILCPVKGTTRWHAVNAIMKKIFRSSLEVLELIPSMIKVHKGIPGEDVVRRAYFRHPEKRPESDVNVAKDGIGVMWFVPTVPFRGQEVEKYVNVCKECFKKHEFDFYMTILVLNARTVVPLTLILYDVNDEESCRRAKALYDDMYRDALDRGYQQYRCAHPGWSEIFSICPELRAFYDTVKHAIDPNNIMAPGRYGIGMTKEATNA